LQIEAQAPHLAAFLLGFHNESIGEIVQIEKKTQNYNERKPDRGNQNRNWANGSLKCGLKLYNDFNLIQRELIERTSSWFCHTNWAMERVIASSLCGKIKV